MESYKIMNQDFYLSSEMQAVTGMNSGVLKKVQSDLKIQNKEFQREGRKYQGVSKQDVIKILCAVGYTRLTTKEGKNLLVRKIIEIK